MEIQETTNNLMILLALAVMALVASNIIWAILLYYVVKDLT